MRICALLTGRGNNTLKDKNVLDILGHPVLYYPAHAARSSKYIDSFYCSSDDESILGAAETEGYTKIMRPHELASPTAQHVDAIMHALHFIEAEAGLPDILVVLLANNVTVKSVWIDVCIEKMKNDMSLSAVVPIYEDNDHHPLRGKRINEAGRLVMYEQGVTMPISTNRQDLPQCYFLAHNFWVLNVSALLASNGKGQPPWQFMGDNISYLEISESIDIHKEEDLILAKEWVAKHYADNN